MDFSWREIGFLLEGNWISPGGNLIPPVDVLSAQVGPGGQEHEQGVEEEPGPGLWADSQAVRHRGHGPTQHHHLGQHCGQDGRH